TLTNKYEHLTSVRKANPPFAEAVLNSFKSKLLNVVSTQALYDSEDSSDVETEWPLGNDAPYMEASPDEYSTSNYLSLTPAAVADAASQDCFKHASDAGVGATGLLSPEDEAAGESDSVGFGGDDMGMFPPNIEEALRRILANNNSQALSDTFTTFAAASDADVAKGQDDAGDAQYVSESGSCSPESVGEPPEYLSTADPVDIFVRSFSANGSWEAVPQLQPADGSLTPCKRKRNTDKEDQQAEANAAAAKPAPSNMLPRATLPVSPRKRSRSTSHGDAAAVPAAQSTEQTPAAAA
ncbi:hypothetical protein IWW50_006682, partial [Coemansia erecta]